MNLWSVCDFIPVGKKLISVFPGWDIFSNLEELKHVNGNTFKITKTNPYYSEGELVKFDLDKKGRVKSVNYAGMTMLPEKDYIKSIRGKKIIE
jgi:hypothetical protein